MEERARLEALSAVIDLAIQDEDFRREGMRALQGDTLESRLERLEITLEGRGFALSIREMRIIEEFHREKVARTSDRELAEELRGHARKAREKRSRWGR